jgi:hypothetical protein
MTTYKRDYEKLRRNDICPCGSGQKYKNCCLKRIIKTEQETFEYFYNKENEHVDTAGDNAVDGRSNIVLPDSRIIVP